MTLGKYLSRGARPAALGAAWLALGIFAAPALAAPLPTGYLTSGGTERIVQNTAGQCWHTGAWSPSDAVPPCEPGLFSRAAAAPAPQPAAEAQPAPTAEAQPAQPTPPPLEQVSLSSDVLFGFDKAQLRPEGKQKLDEVVKRVSDANLDKVVAIGYADPIGPGPYNQKLSQERAKAVSDYLQSQGLQASVINTDGKGSTNQFSAGQCEGKKGNALIACYQPNRRVEISFYGTRQGQAATGATQPGSSGSSQQK